MDIDSNACRSTLKFELDEAALEKLAENISAIVKKGDVICLNGDLGAGKTTFARAVIRTLLNQTGPAEIPSPSFALVQTYDMSRFPIYHFDFYRICEPEEVIELGLDDAVETGLSLIEWPDKAANFIPKDYLNIFIEDHENPLMRLVTLSGEGSWKKKLERFEIINGFIENSGWNGCSRRFFEGDASTRQYIKLINGSKSAILMDSPKQPDGPPVRNGKAYSQIAHLAEDVTPFYAIAKHLRDKGIYTPEIYSSDLQEGLLLLEDLGGGVFGKKISQGAEIKPLYQRAIDVLLDLRRIEPEREISLDGGVCYRPPLYDRDVFNIEIELLPDWYWPAKKGESISDSAKQGFLSAWNSHIDKISDEKGWVLRDFHSPNLLLTNDKVSVIDFQDAQIGHPAYDLVSLLQDARLDVPAEVEAELLDYYCEACQRNESKHFNRDDFLRSYAILGAQRNTKILGIFARLAIRDHKRAYLAHIPRIWTYLERNLDHPEVENLRAWYDMHFHPAQRQLPLDIN